METENMTITMKATGTYLNGKKVEAPANKRQAESQQAQFATMLKRKLGM
jgi:hypothetical protein